MMWMPSICGDLVGKLEDLLSDVDPWGGICSHLSEYEREMCKVLWQGWPLYSGEVSYPVPGGYEAYVFSSGSDRWEGLYGEARRALCVWLIGRLKLLMGIGAIDRELLIACYKVKYGERDGSVISCLVEAVDSNMMRILVKGRVGGLVQEWPEFSGNVSYPIQGRMGAFFGSLFPWKSSYGEAQGIFLDWLIVRLEGDI